MIFDKLIFIHIPKTAGSSIQNSLIKNYKLIYEGTDKFFDHIKMSKNIKFNDKEIKIIDFKRHLPLDIIKFSNFSQKKPIVAFVRNPYSRAVSLYFECLRSEKYLKELNMTQKTSYDEFLEILIRKKYWFTMPMIDWIGEENLNKVDFIGKFESLNEDIKKLKQKLNINLNLKLHNYNNSIGKKYSPPNYVTFYKNKDNIEKIKKIFFQDLKIFKYNFENFKNYENIKTNKINILINLIKRKLTI